jgi:CTD small phosphatase-like protein 2
MEHTSIPFLPSTYQDTYTLVLDLDETLVHYFFTPSGGCFLIRPYAFEFIENLSKMYEIVIFTAAMKDVILYNISMLIVF